MQPIPNPAGRAVVVGDIGRVVAWRHGEAVTAGRFLAEVAAVARQLPAGSAAVNLCEDRYHFLVAFAAIAFAGQTNLLPPCRAPQAVAEVLAAHPGSYALGDCDVGAEQDCFHRLPEISTLALDPVEPSTLTIPGDHIVAIGYTSGSTGTPKANPKTWRSFCESTRRNVEAIVQALAAEPLNIVATVPPQHMYGMETSVLLPLQGPFAVHAGRPLLPADIGCALAEVPEPRLLVTTPVHLRVVAQDDGTILPPIRGLLSATAPLAADLARQAESRFSAPVLEVFGSTETCVIGYRRTAREDAWRRHEGVLLRPQPDGTTVDAPWFEAPVLLQDIIELLPESRFRLCGRNADLLEIAGKRASLGDLTRRLLAIPGVVDGVVFQGDADAAGVQRVAALAVAPGLTEADLLAALRQSIDPAFLPRPLRLVSALPRNETGKLPRTDLLAALR
ncbi:AMP-binding protein [Tahibacter amnicola]|uniref:Long-chain-fatty-acid--CoA ligase n=1 Tax=Tahibacter amnicola TaxID=2976241 RepID=A0ABY6BMP9_9GAMM|nr:AMP-binding protein [Tahibacter amnicola]UXI70753.1 AMP-binding protein [Tahibacter amnicola]